MLRKILFAVFVALTAVQVGCTSTGMSIGAARANYDKFKDSHSEYMQIGNNVGLLSTRTGDRGRRSYTFTLNSTVYGDAAWWDEVVFLTDGQPMKLKGDSKLQDVNVSQYSVSYREFAAFPITGDQLRRIGHANEVEVRVYGREQNAPPATWDRKRIDAVKKFHYLYVLGNWDRMNEEERKVAKSASWQPPA